MSILNVGEVQTNFIKSTTGTTSLNIDSTGRVLIPNQPSFRVYGPSGEINTIITFASTEYNTGNHMNASTGIFTAPIAGRYLFTFSILCGNPMGVYIRILFCKNSTVGDVSLGDTLTGGLASYGSANMAMIFSLAANDTIRLRADGGGDNAGTRVYGPTWGSFSGCLIG
jgi:hypothetical protein